MTRYRWTIHLKDDDRLRFLDSAGVKVDLVINLIILFKESNPLNQRVSSKHLHLNPIISVERCLS